MSDYPSHFEGKFVTYEFGKMSGSIVSAPKAKLVNEFCKAAFKP